MNSPADNAPSESERLFLSVRSAVSDRHAILEDDGFAVLLYLTSPTDTKPAADCFVYSVVPPTEELVTPHGTSGPPILLRRFASEVALQPNIPANAHRFEFSPDGHSVAVFIRGEPWAFIARDERRGFSKSISAVGPFGQPWSQQLFDDLFPIDRNAS
jgi:hypothetical protein